MCACEALALRQEPELLDQTRLPDPGVAAHIHGKAGCGLKAAGNHRLELTELRSPPDEVLAWLRGRIPQAENSPGCNRTFQPLDGDLAHPLGDDEVRDGLPDRL